MHIFNIHNTLSSINKYYITEARGHLLDGSTALMKIKHNDLGDVRAIDCFKLKKGRIQEGYGIESIEGILSNSKILDFIDKIQKSADKSVDFFDKFLEALAK